MQQLTWEALKQQYPEDKFIFLLPQVDMHVQHNVPLWRLDVATVKIDPDDSSQIYDVNGKLALQRPALDRLLAAANGVSSAHVVHEVPGELYRYLGVAAMKGPDGSIRPVQRSRDWIAEVEREEIANQYRNKADWQREKAWRDERRFGPAKTESKAIARAIRALLGIRSTYEPNELRQKAFAVPRWVFEPPADNPAVLQMLVASALNGQNQLYGGTAQPLQLTGSAPEPEPEQAAIALPAETTANAGGFVPPAAEQASEPDRLKAKIERLIGELALGERTVTALRDQLETAYPDNLKCLEDMSLWLEDQLQQKGVQS